MILPLKAEVRRRHIILLPRMLLVTQQLKVDLPVHLNLHQRHIILLLLIILQQRIIHRKVQVRVEILEHQEAQVQLLIPAQLQPIQAFLVRLDQLLLHLTLVGIQQLHLVQVKARLRLITPVGIQLKVEVQQQFIPQPQLIIVQKYYYYF